MGNMSYCRFRNTAGDLKDCYEALWDITNGAEQLGEEEETAKKQLIKLCCKIADEFGDEE